MKELSLYEELEEVGKGLEETVQNLGQANACLKRAEEAHKAYVMVWDAALAEVRRLRDERILWEAGISPS